MKGGLADLAKLDATAQLKALALKRIGASELLEASIAQAAALSDLGPVVVQKDLERARARAKAIDDRRARGEPPEAFGKLAGLPVTLKDTLDVEHMAATSGVKRYLDRIAGDSIVAGHMRTEGAVIWGKTNVPPMAGDFQTANDIFGVTCNPWNRERTPGGSSGGAAVAVATGVTALEVGSDLSGSLRTPASFCGVLAHKPTYGVVPQRGHVPPAPGTASEPDLNVIGPMARSVRDLRLLLSILTHAPLPAHAPVANLAEVRVGVWIEEPGFVLDPEAASVIEGFAARLSNSGAQVEAVEHLVKGEDLLSAFALLLYSSAADVAPRPWLKGPARIARAMGAGPFSPAGQALAAAASHREWLAANEVRARLERGMRGVFERLDVIVAPCAPVVAFPHDRRKPHRRKLRLSDGSETGFDAMMHWNALASACGLPATVLPVGRARSGLPVGVQLIGPRGGDSRLLALAQAIEEQITGFVPPPLG